MSTTPRPVNDGDLAWVHALNELHAIELSSLSVEQFGRLVDTASYARVIDEGAAFLLAFDQDAEYAGTNFLWFKTRLTRFIYVDRVAVSASDRGRGLARALYEDLFAYARTHGTPCIVCEVNSDLPNPASDAFHASLGFKAMGQAKLSGADKTVRYLKLEILQAD